jgi:hypothetical protein
MPVLRIGGQSLGVRLAGTVDQDARKQPNADYPKGRRSRHSLAWNCGFENAAGGDEWPLRRAVCVFPHPARGPTHLKRSIDVLDSRLGVSTHRGRVPQGPPGDELGHIGCVRVSNLW